MKPITSGYFYESDFFSTLDSLGKIILPGPGCASPVLVRNDFLSAAEAGSLASWQAGGAGGADDSLFGKSMPGAHIVAPGADGLALCEALAKRAGDELEKAFGLRVARVVDARAVTLPEGASAMLHTDHADRQYDADGWPVKWPSTVAGTLMTLLFFLTDSVEEAGGEDQCVGGNIEFPYIFDAAYETLLLEPRRHALIAFPDHPVYAYRIHEVYENQSRFVAAWVEVEN